MLRSLIGAGVSRLSSVETHAPVADDWVQRMIDSPGRSGHLKSGEHTTHYLEWGDASNPRVLLLLHGFRGHAHWWDFVAPWFAADYRVIAPDFSGMGDSSARLNYHRSDFVAEVLAILKMIGAKAVTLVGHSFGGRIAVFAAHEYPQLLAHAIVIDTNIGFADQPLRTRFVQRPKKIYPDFKTACSRFRFVPDEPPILPRIMQHLAAHSIKQQDGGFAITSSHLAVKIAAKGADKAAAQRAADTAKANCPVSKLLKAEVTMDATIEV